MKKAKVWSCQECGKTQAKWAGVCTECNQWNTFVEQTPILSNKESKRRCPVLLDTINTKELSRVSSGLKQWDHLLGGGVVSGALTLLVGAPGIGKSTLLLQTAYLYAQQGYKVLYVSGEESEQQVALRASRMGVFSKNLYVFSETCYEEIIAAIQSIDAAFVFVDSVQILYKKQVVGAPGSIIQVKALTMGFLHLAKMDTITTFLVGHVTKTGDLAGPRVLEHLVDTVLEFEGEKQHGFRILRSIKNRFGSTQDIALFQMNETGLKEEQDPSKTFLQGRTKTHFGKAVTCAMEGNKAFLLEIQALVTRCFLTTPYRKSHGIDQNRLPLLLAVLEKSLGYKMYESDVFVSVTGGMKVKETAMDLAIICAISSSRLQKPIGFHTAFLGEVGLAGEIKSCSRLDIRLKEAQNFGLQKAVIPKKNVSNIPDICTRNMEILGVETVEQALQIMGD